MESYHGHVRTQLDAILLFEACRQGLIPRIRRRLSERERLQIGSGSVYIWDEQEAGMRRWTDSKSWSASRVSGAFLTYREMEGNRSKTSTFAGDEADSPDSKSGPASPTSSEEGYKYKVNGLYKQSFSIVTSTGLKLHLISYYSKEDLNSGKLIQPSTDINLRSLHIPIDLYPDAPPGSVSIPAVTTTPLGPVMPNQQQYRSQQPQSGMFVAPSQSSGVTKAFPQTPSPISQHSSNSFTGSSYAYSQPSHASGYFPPYMADKQPLLKPTTDLSNASSVVKVSSFQAPAPNYNGVPLGHLNEARPEDDNATNPGINSLLQMPIPQFQGAAGNPNSPEISEYRPYVKFTEDKRALHILDRSLVI